VKNHIRKVGIIIAICTIGVAGYRFRSTSLFAMKTLLIAVCMSVMPILAYAEDVKKEKERPSFEEAFASAVKRCNEMSTSPAKWPMVKFSGRAEMLAKEYRDPDTEFLKRKASPEARGAGKKLAMMVLVKYASDKAARDVIFELADREDRVALNALRYMEPAAARSVAQRLLTESRNGWVRAAAVDIIGIVGDAASLKLLKELQAKEQNRLVMPALKATIPWFEYRLAMPDEADQARWVKLETLWQEALEAAPTPIIVQEHYLLAAKYLHRKGVRFPLKFIEFKLRAEGPHGIGARITAIAVIWQQKETKAVPLLKTWALRGGEEGALALAALAELGTSDAISAIESAIIETCTAIEREERYLRGIIETLTWYGNARTSGFLGQLSEDERYSKELRAAFKAAAEAIEKRLNQKK